MSVAGIVSNDTKDLLDGAIAFRCETLCDYRTAEVELQEVLDRSPTDTESCKCPVCRAGFDLALQLANAQPMSRHLSAAAGSLAQSCQISGNIHKQPVLYFLFFVSSSSNHFLICFLSSESTTKYRSSNQATNKHDRGLRGASFLGMQLDRRRWT
jgi:hypothetical protein